MTASWGRARTIADAVLYEGYLLYPYRASSGKNQSRWQFGVLGPPGAAEAGIGEDDTTVDAAPGSARHRSRAHPGACASCTCSAAAPNAIDAAAEFVPVAD